MCGLDPLGKCRRRVAEDQSTGSCLAIVSKMDCGAKSREYPRSTQSSSDARPIAQIQDKEELKQGSGKAKRSGRDRSHRWDQQKLAAGCGEQERGKGKRQRPGLRPSSWDDLGAKMYSILNLLDLRGLIEIR